MELSTVVTTALHVAGIALFAIQAITVAIVVANVAVRGVRSLARTVAAVAGHVHEAARGQRSWRDLEGVRGAAGRDASTVLLWLACAVAIGIAEAIVIHPSVAGDIAVGVTMAFPAVWLLGVVGAIVRALLELRAPVDEPPAVVDPGAKALAA